MKASSSKEKILKKIRQALAQPVPVPFPQSEGTNNVFKQPTNELELEFAQNFTSIAGKFSFCADEMELSEQLAVLVKGKALNNVYCDEEPLKNMLLNNKFDKFTVTDLASCDAAITTCEMLVARTGSILLTSANGSGRTASIYAPIHICVAYSDQLVYDVKDGLQIVKDKYAGKLPSLITLASGPSRTADIEKTLVVGVHGPKEVYVFLVDRNLQ
jgi:L-lactate dehydrogenase complex protein LldG